MKLPFLPLIFLTVALCACTAESDEPSGTVSRAIAFRAETTDGGTRGEIARAEELTAFSVWGWANDASERSTQVFAGKRVGRNGDAWEYAPLVYWMPGHTYRFLAFATSETDDDSGLSVAASTTFTTWPEAATASLTLSPPYDEDIVYAYAEQQSPSLIGDISPVALTFRHALARLKVQVREAIIANCHVQLSRVTFTPHATSATFVPNRIAYTTITPPPTINGQPVYTTTYDVELAVASTTPATTPFVLCNNHSLPFFSQSMLLVPGAAGTLRVEYQLWQNNPSLMLKQYDETFLISGDMQAGHSYQATIMLPSAQTVVSLQGTLEPWGDDNDTDREILAI